MYQAAKKLAQDEKFELANQIRRAAVSLTNNIAEGHGRYHFWIRSVSRYSREARWKNYWMISMFASMSGICRRKIDSLKQQGWRVRQLIDGYVRYLRQQKRFCRWVTSVREESPEYSEEIGDSRFSI